MSLEDLIELRHIFTGESWEQARQIIRRNTTPQQMRAALAAHRHRQSVAHRISADRSVTDSNLRTCLLPDAASLSQRLLETSLLLAVHDCQGSILREPYRGHKVFSAVSPRRDVLMVDLAEEVLERFLRALLPPLTPWPSSPGVPGLRFVPTRRHLRMHLLNQKNELTDACVIIRNVNASTWKQIWPEIRRSFSGEDCIDPILGNTQRLSPGEREDFDFHRSQCGPVALGSMMLRRIGLLKDSFAVDTWEGNGGTVINVEIHDGPSVYSILDSLAHPIFGIIDDAFVLANGTQIDTGMGHARIVDYKPTPSRFAGDARILPTTGRHPALLLRTLPDTTTAPRESGTVPAITAPEVWK
ncbi:hypothetical protein [Saccharopolyspora sp. NPDC002578]